MYALQLDGWQSGRLRTLGKRVFLNRNPGFESLPIRKLRYEPIVHFQFRRVNLA